MRKAAKTEKTGVFSRILIPTDLTDGAARSLKLALALARGGQATVTLVHVVQQVAGLPPREMRAFYDRLVKKSRRRLAGASKLFAARGITVRSQILIGDRRRFLVTSLAGALVGPLVARAQPAKLPTIGFLGPNTPSLDSHRVGAFVQRLRELGWIEGRNVAIEYRWGEGRVERLAEIAAELVRLKVDIIVTSATRPVVAAKQATSVIPIVFAAVGDPVGTGLVASLARPGGNVTGLSLQATDLAAKRTGLLREVVPGLRRLAIMANSATPAAVVEMREVQATARTLGLEVVTSEIRRPEDIAPAFEALKGRAEALYVCNDPLVTTHRISINTLALGVRLPAMYNVREFVEAGGLMSYGPSFLDLYRRTADFVDKILRGVKPADIPVEQPTKFELVINLKTAKALGLTIPPSLLARADQVIDP